MKNLRRLFVLLFLAFQSHACVAGTLVQFEIYFGLLSPLGEVDVEMYDQDKPATVSNFLRLIQAGDYELSIFHRLEPGFVLQGGSFFILNPYTADILAPPFTNIFPVPNFGDISNEFNVGKFYSNTNWTIAMAKTSDPNSANSGFFFNLGNNSASLDQATNAGGFTVFGRVVRGTNVLAFFNELGYGGGGLFNLESNYGPSGLFPELPADSGGTNPPPYYQLVYFAADVLTLQANLTTNNARELSWYTISGVTNNLEYATNLPPVWNVLFSTNGTGNSVTYLDSTTNITRRFYRVHVLF